MVDAAHRRKQKRMGTTARTVVPDQRSPRSPPIPRATNYTLCGCPNSTRMREVPSRFTNVNNRCMGRRAWRESNPQAVVSSNDSVYWQTVEPTIPKVVEIVKGERNLYPLGWLGRRAGCQVAVLPAWFRAFDPILRFLPACHRVISGLTTLDGPF